MFGDGVLLNRGEKMTRSIWNVADPRGLAEAFGIDQLRYLLLSEVIFGNDWSYSPEDIVQRTNSDLANSFGNRAQRTLMFIKKNLDGRLPHGERTDADHELLTLVTQAVATEFPATMQDFALSQAIDIWLRAVFACNAYIDTQAPWTLRKTDPQRMEAVLSTLYEAIGTLSLAIPPILPVSAGALLD